MRYDDRGVGASTGDFSAATTADFSRDAEAALDYLRTRPKDIDPRRIGFIGHSEGGLIAPLVAVRRPDDVGFIVLLSAPGVRGDSLLMMQSDTIMRLTHQPARPRPASTAPSSPSSSKTLPTRRPCAKPLPTPSAEPSPKASSPDPCLTNRWSHS